MADQEVDAAYITFPISIAYLTGFHANPHERLMALAVHQESATLIVPAIERDRAAQIAGELGVVAWRDGEDPYTFVRDALAGMATVAVEKDHLTLRAAEALQAMTGAAAFTDISAEVRRLRRTKNAIELEKLRRAAEITDAAYEAIVGRIHVGQSKLEVASMIADSIHSLGGTLAFDPSVQFGKNSAEPHHHPSGHELREGDLVLIDFGAAFDGYHADTTRVLVAGEPTQEQREAHRTVLAAHDAAIAATRAGVSAGAVDAAAREVVEKEGRGPDFYHRTGHGLGLEIHEDPSLDPASPVVLEAGMVATIEPGVYVAGWGGIRIEDDIVVEAKGARLLTHSDRSLRVIK